jgi:hypothetical protein
MSTDARGSGTNKDTIAEIRTNTPIQRAMKSHILFIFSVFGCKVTFFYGKVVPLSAKSKKGKIVKWNQNWLFTIL